MNRRTHVVLPDQLVKDIDTLVGRRSIAERGILARAVARVLLERVGLITAEDRTTA
jgi:Arc/MetJ-type ribon-helix-helix transcriptional regulator